MDTESKALLHFSVIIALWVLLPLIPAWLTFKITPGQSLGMKGPFQGMTLRATGSFVAYLVVALLLSTITWHMASLLVGRLAGDSTWKIVGRAKLYDSEGREATELPDLRTAYLRVLPDQNVIDTSFSIKVAFPRDAKPTVYIEVPDWGGAKISLNDPEEYEEDALNRIIRLKTLVQIRQQPRDTFSIGDQRP